MSLDEHGITNNVTETAKVFLQSPQLSNPRTHQLKNQPCQSYLSRMSWLSSRPECGTDGRQTTAQTHPTASQYATKSRHRRHRHPNHSRHYRGSLFLDGLCKVQDNSVSAMACEKWHEDICRGGGMGEWDGLKVGYMDVGRWWILMWKGIGWRLLGAAEMVKRNGLLVQIVV